MATTLVTTMALGMYQWTAFKVGRAREQFGIKAPATTGNEEFERIYRVQMNTLEQLVFFLPGLWMSEYLINDSFAASLGVIWCVGRMMYAQDYYKSADKRHVGFMISVVAAIILLIGSVIGAFLQG